MAVTTKEKVTTKKKQEELDWTAAREEWVEAVNQLVQQITEWTKDAGWTVTTTEREINEENIGVYRVPDAKINTPQGQLMLEAWGRGYRNNVGRVELAAWPGAFRVLLLHRVGETDWRIYTDSGITLRYPWTRETFLNLAEDLLGSE